MGCTPSIHVSQTGVIYCHENSDDSLSQAANVHSTVTGNASAVVTASAVQQPAKRGSNHGGNGGVQSGSRCNSLKDGGGGGRSSSSATASVFSNVNVSKKNEKNNELERKNNHECESTVKLVDDCKSLAVKQQEEQQQGTAKEISFGPMRLQQPTMSVLLVFSKDDPQSQVFCSAAATRGYHCQLAHTADVAKECFLEARHHVIIIDHRNSKHLDAEALCRSIRATKASEHTSIVAVTKRQPNDREEASILPLLQAGFNRVYLENVSVGACLNELLTLEHNDLRYQMQLQACHALITALNHAGDAVEISNTDHQIQYVNPAYERLTGYSSEEILGKDSRALPQNDKNRPEVYENVRTQIKKGKPWSGAFYVRRKTGEHATHHCHIMPVLGNGSCINHYVYINCVAPEMLHHIEKIKDGDIHLNQIANGSVHIPNIASKRRDSIARIHSMTIEAPITKVINIINAAQEDSPVTVAQALDRVLEILRTSELYSPYLMAQQIRDQDQMTSDLLGGLMSQSIRRRFSANDAHVNKPSSIQCCPINLNAHPHPHIASSPTTALNQLPESIQNILDLEQAWEFNIIHLEQATNNRPLIYLGIKIMLRFGVCEYLNISESCLWGWLQMIEAHYHSENTYHNSTHAADVLHATAYFLDRERSKSVFDQMDEVSALIAAVVHDLDHPGRTNAFLVNARNELAILYNDLTVLENHHAAFTFQLTAKDPQYNIFKNLERDDFKCMRQTIIDMVLATDMSKHFEHHSRFCNSINKGALQMDEESCSIRESGALTDPNILSQLSSPENRAIIKRMMIKCADVSNPVRPLELCMEWAKRIAEEYCIQTDEEKSQGLPVVMPVFDRKTCSIPKCQTSFIDVFINDMFEAWDFFCPIPEAMTHLQNNYKYWQEQEEIEAHERLNSDTQAVLSDDET